MFSNDLMVPKTRETADLGVLGNHEVLLGKHDSISELMAEQSSKQASVDNDKSNNDPAFDLKF